MTFGARQGAAEEAGPAQLTRYVEKLQAMLIEKGDNRIVRPGDPLGVELGPVPNITNPGEFITAKDGKSPGMITYTWSKEQRPGEPERVRHPYPIPQPSPVPLKDRGRRPDWTTTRPITAPSATTVTRTAEMPRATVPDGDGGGGGGWHLNVPTMTPQQQQQTAETSVVGIIIIGFVVVLA